MNDSQGEFLVKEYEEMSRYIQTFWTVRASILGAGFALFGLILSQSREADLTYRYVLYACAYLLVFALERMIGATTRNQYLYSFRMSRIADAFQVHGFWSVWPEYLKRRPSDSGSAAYVYTLRLLNLLCCLYVVAFEYRDALQSHFVGYRSWFAWVAMVIAVVVWVALHALIRRSIDPAQFWSLLHEHWVDAEKSVHSEARTGLATAAS